MGVSNTMSAPIAAPRQDAEFRRQLPTLPPRAGELEGVARFEREIAELGEWRARLENLARLIGDE